MTAKCAAVNGVLILTHVLISADAFCSSLTHVTVANDQCHVCLRTQFGLNESLTVARIHRNF